MKSIINTNNVDTTKQPLFFGEGLNLQRYDKHRYKKIYDLFLQQLSFFWRPEEVDLSGKEKNDYEQLTDHQKFIFTKNLGYQILLDSVQSRGISHLLEDYNLNIPESDQTHMHEIRKFHDFAKHNFDPSPADYNRMLDENEYYRVAHHHVFNLNLLEQCMIWADLKIVFSATIDPISNLILAKLKD